MNRYISSTVALSVLLGSSLLLADESSGLTGCAQESDDSARLACYDRLAGASKANEAAAAAAAAKAAEAAAEAEARATAEAAEAEARAAEAEAMARAEAAAAAATAAEAEAAATAKAAEEEFGMNPDLEKKKPPEERKDANELRELNAEVVEVKKRPGGELIVTLENGQTWVEKTAVYGFRVDVGDTILLKKGVFGGYRMVGRGRRASQVRRVE